MNIKELNLTQEQLNKLDGFSIISTDELNALVEFSLMYDALIDIGVDNWEGYEAAMELFEEWNN